MPTYNPQQIDRLSESINYLDNDGQVTQLPLNETTLRKFGMEKWTNALWPLSENTISASAVIHNGFMSHRSSPETSNTDSNLSESTSKGNS